MPRPTRRKTKSITACETCYERKTRCELVTELGCHRCQVLRINCSLGQATTLIEGTAATPTRSGPGATLTSGDLTDAQILADLRDRVIQMQTQLHDLSRPASSSRLDGGTISRTSLDHTPPAEPSVSLEIDPQIDASTPMAGLQRVGPAVPLDRCTVSELINDALGIRFDVKIKDPISSGILSEADYRRVWQR